MDYREEAIECVKDHVLPLHKQVYAKYDGDFDRIYSEGYNSKGRSSESHPSLLEDGRVVTELDIVKIEGTDVVLAVPALSAGVLTMHND